VSSVGSSAGYDPIEVNLFHTTEKITETNISFQPNIKVVIMSSPSSPIHYRHPLTIAAVHPSTIPGFASLKLIMNPSAAFPTSSFSSTMVILSSSVSSPVGNLELSAVGGKVKLLLVRNCFATVGVGPGSVLGGMRDGRKPRSERRCGWKRVEFVVASGVRVDIEFRR
jgi:hypothetical protein